MKFGILWGWQVNDARGIPPMLPEFDEDESTWQGLKDLSEKETIGRLNEMKMEIETIVALINKEVKK